jgi:NAD(P)-dependent dehydrogenase (short-subunit alcohol dehydrogenase family)
MTDKARLDGKVALVTGAGGGIGRAIAIEFARAGADVAIAEIIPERCEEAVARVRELGRRALGCVVDMMSAEAILEMVGRVDAEFGRIDILVNNAGGTACRPFLQQNEASWQRHIDLNLMSVLRATHAVAPVMIREGRGGAIINVASIEASRAAPFFAVYAACKAGMVSFTRTMALELAEHGIRVNAIAPDHTVSPGTRGNRSGPVDESTWFTHTPAEAEAMRQLIPLGRQGVDVECGDAALFLASAMSTYITGVVLPLDGGTWASSGWVRLPDGGWTLNQGVRIAPLPDPNRGKAPK